MKRFMYFSIAMLCLSVSVLIGFHIGSESAVAQAPEPISGWRTESGAATAVNHFVMLSNGDLYCRKSANSTGVWQWWDNTTYVGNFWGGAVSTAPGTWSTIKGLYDEKK